MALIVRKENFEKLMNYKEKGKEDHHFFEWSRKNNKSLKFVSLGWFIKDYNGKEELGSSHYIITFLKTAKGFLMLHKLECGCWKNGDTILFHLIRLGIVELWEDRKSKTIYQINEEEMKNE